MFELAHPDARAPARATEGSAGYDLRSCEALEVPPGGRRLVDTGVRLAFEGAFYARIASRSGLAVRGIDVAAGVCDADYRGTYRVLLVNNSDAPFEVEPGDRIAQLVFEAIVHPVLVDAEGDMLNEGDELGGGGKGARGDGGFGSTGVK
jgi:dUTP pyrophosphatase